MLKARWLEQIGKRCQHLPSQVRASSVRALLAVLYFVFLLPFGVFFLLFTDTLSVKNLPAEWLDRPDEVFDIQSARKP
ncbi:MAG TPA: hypothetical protein VLY23_06560 [Candidatus Acidoferrum sp.]|nr:hypothetical protein [Candidatus Acidoferrum sp.]